MVAASKSSAQANLFQGPIRGLPIILPPLEKQLQFDAVASRTVSLGVRFDMALKEVDALTASLQSRHFQ
jgi:type I restriction enzyme S subunit